MPESAQRYHILSCEELALLAVMAGLLLPITLSCAEQMLLFPRAGRQGAKHGQGWDLKSDSQYSRDGKSPKEVTSLSGPLQRCLLWKSKPTIPQKFARWHRTTQGEEYGQLVPYLVNLPIFPLMEVWLEKWVWALIISCYPFTLYTGF